MRGTVSEIRNPKVMSLKRKDGGKAEISHKRATKNADTGKEKTFKVRPLYPIAPLSLKEREEFQGYFECHRLGRIASFALEVC